MTLYLDNLAEAIAEDQQAPKARIIKQLKERELQWSVAHKIRFIRGKMSLVAQPSYLLTNQREVPSIT
jgi:hypothetical protein